MALPFRETLLLLCVDWPYMLISSNGGVGSRPGTEQSKEFAAYLGHCRRLEERRRVGV